MIVSSRLLRLLTIVGMVLLLTPRAEATGNTTSGGGVSTGSFTVSFVDNNTQFANLSLYDCMHSQPFDFQFAYPYNGGQSVEYVLSLNSTCETPNSASFPGPTSCTSVASNSCPSMLLSNAMTVSQPADNMTTDFGATNATVPTLTTGGIWGFYTTQETNMSSTATYTTEISSNTTMCGPPGTTVNNTLIYICALLSGTSATSSTVPYGALSIALNSSIPGTPEQPSVTPLDSGLSVSWNAITNAYYYNVIVVEASSASATDAGTVVDAGSGDGGTTSAVDAGTVVASTQVSDQTTAQIYGLQNGVNYLVYVQALDNSGTSPPTTSNMSDLSPPGAGIPAPSYSYFQEYKAAGGTENGCSSTGLPAAFALVAALLILRRRRQRRTSGAGLGLLLAVAGLSLPARAEEEPSTAPPAEAKTTVEVEGTSVETPVVRQPSIEWVRVEVMTGPYNPNPDQGLSSKPFATVFPNKNQLLWQVQLHANLYGGFGHLSLGLGVGVWSTSGHALTQTGAQAGDTETFTLYPISPILGYRADFIYTLWNVPLIPYVKAGWGFVVFEDLKDGKATSGTTNGKMWTSEGWATGFQWAVGLEFPLDFFDQERSANLDQDFGINSVGIFGEYAQTYWKGLNGGLPLGGWNASGGLYLAW